MGESIAGVRAEAARRLPAGMSAECRATLLPGGAPPAPGQLVRFPQLAKTLERVARKGREGFYEGPVAEAIAGTISSGGVPTTPGDFAEQRGEWVEPLAVPFRDRTVLGLPPNSQSVVALVALGILDGFELAAMDESTRLHHEIEALRLGFEVAIDTVGEPTPEMTTRVESALTPAALAAARGRIGARATLPVHPQGGNSSDTTYVCAVDRDGNAVSLMTSICGTFGSGLLAGSTGVILNNRASQFSTRQGHPNALAPRRRPRHTILPGMVLREGSPEFVLGCIGHNNHPQSQAQTLVNVLDLEMNPQQAVDAPRFRVVMTTDELQLDERLHARLGHELASRGHRLGDPKAFKSDAQMVRIHDGRDGVGPCL